jgi:antitoxin component YwqK of YwqJK toxin-antitoxin module
MIWPVQQDFYTFIPMNKLLLILTLFVLGETNSIYGQEIQCLFNPYNKIGSNYFFSTYWDVSPSILMNGTCIQYMSNTKDIYEKRVFKNGIIQLELTNYINPTRIRTSFERVKRDSTIAEYKQFREDGKLERTTKYYHDQTERRCWQDSHYYPNGKMQSVESYAALRAEELKGFSSDVIPEHTIDSEGYGWQTVPVGVSKTYFQNGKLNTLNTYSYSKNALAKYDLGLNGPHEAYTEEGVLVSKGQYVDGRKNGEWRHYFFDGKLSHVQTYKDDFGVGTWVSYNYNTGKIETTEEFNDEKYYWPIPHTIRYNELGKVVYEKEILLDGRGFEKSYFDNGTPNDITIYYHGPSEISEYYAYFETGQLKRKTYYRAKNDTLSAEYFEDGSMKHLNLTPNIGSGNTKQTTANYYSPGKLESQTFYTYKDGITDQHIEKFYENGKFKWELILHEKNQTERDFYENGKLQSEKNYSFDMLNGNWIQKDSLGNVLKNCFYSSGFKFGKCETPSVLKIGAAPKDELKVWRAAVISAYLRQFYNNSIQDPSPSFIEKEKIDKDAEIIWKVVEYCNQNGYTFLPNANEKIDGKISYTFNAPVSAYDPHEQQIDSILVSRGFTISNKTKQAGYCAFQLTTEDYHGIASFNEMFAKFFPFNSGYFYANNLQSEVDYGLKGYRNFSSFLFERRENEKAYIVTLNNYGSSKLFTLYDDGDIEFYNGRGDWSQPDMSNYQHMWWD